MAVRAEAELSHREHPPAYVDLELLRAEDKKWTPKKIALWVAISLVGALS